MRNTQKPEGSRSGGLDNLIDVHSIWDTVQGEGPFAGEPAIFVRLAGCNLQCPLCDTDYTSQRQSMTPAEVRARVENLIPTRRRASLRRPLVVFTGGEPYRQNLHPVLDELIHGGFARVQIETNGTMWQNLPFGDNLTVVCSPKTAKVHPAIYREVDAWKYVVEAGHTDPEDGLPTRVLGYDHKVMRPPASSRVYIQPMDVGDEESNKFHLAEAVHVCREFGYQLCLQVHKIVGLP